MGRPGLGTAKEREQGLAVSCLGTIGMKGAESRHPPASADSRKQDSYFEQYNAKASTASTTERMKALHLDVHKTGNRPRPANLGGSNLLFPGRKLVADSRRGREDHQRRHWIITLPEAVGCFVHDP